jgi:hypothetical protein
MLFIAIQETALLIVYLKLWMLLLGLQQPVLGTAYHRVMLTKILPTALWIVAPALLGFCCVGLSGQPAYQCQV